jgi:hypothetical protein
MKIYMLILKESKEMGTGEITSTQSHGKREDK